MRKPKILIDIFYLHVAQTGIKTYIQTLCEEIRKQQNSEFEFILSPDFEKINTSRFFKGKTSLLKNLLFQAFYFFRKQLWLPLLSYKHGADMILSPDIMSPSWGKGHKVSVIHDTFFWDNPEHYQGLWLKYYLFFLKKGLKKNASVVTITEFSKKKLLKLPIFQKLRIDVAYPSSGLHLPEGKPKRLENKEKYFLHVGVMEKRKNLGLLIKAFGKLIKEKGFEDFRLYLVGQRGPREALDDFDQLQNLVEGLQLQGKVIFPGYVSQDQLKIYFQNALAYVFPSANEGFGLPVLEAFSFGLPVIISNQGALQEVAGEAALVLEKNEPDSLKQAMKKLAEDGTLREELAQKGINRLKEFTTEKFFLSLKDIFKSLLDE
ncbi:glycosyltransferase family 4 protein [Shivajiella indica]|uniref:Glycosyltransferase family 4 protein n=1 Tax=Shivajiella indica TaxID=872115 RepID=A0ABW5BFQ1_9BACT